MKKWWAADKLNRIPIPFYLNRSPILKWLEDNNIDYFWEPDRHFKINYYLVFKNKEDELAFKLIFDL